MTAGQLSDGIVRLKAEAMQVCNEYLAAHQSTGGLDEGNRNEQSFDTAFLSVISAHADVAPPFYILQHRYVYPIFVHIARAVDLMEEQVAEEVASPNEQGCKGSKAQRKRKKSNG
jgi:hypothetical protein